MKIPFAASLALLCLSQTVHAGGWTVTPIAQALGLGPDGYATATAINAHGDLVGQYRAGNELHGYLFRGGVLTDLTVRSGLQGPDYGGLSQDLYPTALSDSGSVGGHLGIYSGFGNPFVYHGGAFATPFGIKPYGVHTVAGINPAGQAVIDSVAYDGSWLYRDGQLSPIGGGSGFHVSAVNAAGAVAGSLFDGKTGWAAWQVDGELRTFGPEGGISSAQDINDRNELVGSSASLADGQYTPRAFLYANGEFKDLGVLHEGDRLSHANALNNQGWIVGTSIGPIADAEGWAPSRAFLYRDGRMVDLNDGLDYDLGEGRYLAEAFDVNDRGQILALDATGRTYLLTPVPEPETYALFLSGLGVTAVLARRRARKAARI